MQKRFLFLWLTFWLTSATVFIYVLDPLGISHMHKSELTVLYFVVCGVGGGVLFGGDRVLRYLKYTRGQLKWIAISCVIFLMSMILIQELTQLDIKMEQKLIAMKFYFPLLKINLGFTKFADIFFQQTLILSLILYLRNEYENHIDIIKIFTVVFFLLHAPLLFVFGWGGSLFVIPSLFAGGLFSLFILKTQYGLLYSFLLHEFFYLALALIIRLL